jgi:hypothetical protein
MKSLKLSSIFTASNSIPLIFFVFIFIAVGMFFIIQKTTEKQKQNELQKQNRVVEEKNILNRPTEPLSNSGVTDINNTENKDNDGAFSSEHNTVNETFLNEMGLFIKKDETRPEVYSHNPIYIPPFDAGKETRCVTRHVNRPNETNIVHNILNSDLVKTSSDASF